MHLGSIAIDYIGHVCFRFRASGGGTLITDPFFADGFPWKDHVERYLSPPDVKAEEIDHCDLIFISHIHGDHFDPEAVRTIHDRTGCRILAPHDVLDVLRNDGISPDALLTCEEGGRFRAGALDLHTYCGYDLKYTAEDGSQNKYALTVTEGATSLFYSGDCHALPPAVRGMSFTAMLCWPEPNDEVLVSLCTGLDTDCFVLMHGDRFDPGEFICNLDYAAEKRRLEKLVPGMRVLIPEKVEMLS